MNSFPTKEPLELGSAVLSAIRGWLIGNKAAGAHALRVMIACLGAYGLSLTLGLQHGFWSVFTALIVMQASVGATLGAAIDRLVGTVAGAILGEPLFSLLRRSRSKSGCRSSWSSASQA
jgi:uncharacterized membrane protein YccC